MEFNRNGIRFEYPENWIIEEDSSQDGAFSRITASAPDGAFWSLSRQPAEVQTYSNISPTPRTEQLRVQNTLILKSTLRSDDIFGCKSFWC